MSFAGCTGEPSSAIEVFPWGSGVRKASEVVGSFSPRLDLDLADLAPYDAGGPEQAPALRPGVRRALITGTDRSSFEKLSQHPDICVLVFSDTLKSCCEWWWKLGQGRVYALGGRAYSRSERDAVRDTQRLLPLAEVDLVVAARTAALESGAVPLWVSVNLDVLQPQAVPRGEYNYFNPPGGVDLDTLRTALAALPGERILGFEVTGVQLDDEGWVSPANFLSALTAAELLRDNILTWWAPDKIDV